MMRAGQTTWHYVMVLVLLSLPEGQASPGDPQTSATAKRQWLFHCGGWGPGCMKIAAAKVCKDCFPHLSFNPQYRDHPKADGKFEPTFILTSGSSWGAIGKRSLIPDEQGSFQQLLLYVLLSKTGFLYKDIIYREMVRRYMQQRLRHHQDADVPQLS